MKVALASSEVVPFAKTGGLADVCGALPIELAKAGHEIIVFLPEYRVTRQAGVEIVETDIHIDIPIGGKTVSGQLLKSHLPDSNVVIYLVRQPHYYDRDGIYQFDGRDFQDNCERYVFFCRFVLESFSRLDWYPELVHCNDWQTGLIPAYLKTVYSDRPGFESIASLITIHNLAYQGHFWHWDMLSTGIDWKHFNWREMEFFGRLNLLKTGIVFADAISTVSPTYAREIQTEEQGYGLHEVLAERSDVLSGVLNGIDDRVWNPECDPHIAMNYTVENWQEGKAACKAALQNELQIDESPAIPLIGVVGRMASQKGWGLIIDVMRSWIIEGKPIQWAILGTGEEQYQSALSELKHYGANSLGLHIGFSDELAHRIEAGADLFLMPSQYEPCGLNQQYSMQYGTVPVVRRTGGLADTVVHSTLETVNQGTANGFVFDSFDSHSLKQVTQYALETFDNKAIWNQLVENGMRRDWSWAASASAYERLYESTIGAERRPKQPA